jgi:uncharacterized RDD family membrane protein YckC
MAEPNPYEAPSAALVDHGTVADDAHLADRGVRLLAAIIDTVLLLAINLPLMWSSGYLESVMGSAARGVQESWVTTLMWTAIGFAIFVVVQGVPLARSGQTIGKKLLRIRIAHLDGSKPTLATLLAKRYLPVNAINVVPFVGGLLGLINVLLIFRADRRCGHDLVAGTQVVKIG